MSDNKTPPYIPTIDEAIQCAASWENSLLHSGMALFRRVAVVLMRRVNVLKAEIARLRENDVETAVEIASWAALYRDTAKERDALRHECDDLKIRLDEVKYFRTPHNIGMSCFLI